MGTCKSQQHILVICLCESKQIAMSFINYHQFTGNCLQFFFLYWIERFILFYLFTCSLFFVFILYLRDN